MTCHIASQPQTLSAALRGPQMKFLTRHSSQHDAWGQLCFLSSIPPHTEDQLLCSSSQCAYSQHVQEPLSPGQTVFSLLYWALKMITVPPSGRNIISSPLALLRHLSPPCTPACSSFLPVVFFTLPTAVRRGNP